MTFKSIAEFLDPKNGHRPTSAERKLIAATQAGRPCIFNDPKNPTRPTGPSESTTIRAPLLRLLILGGTQDCRLHESGVWLEGGWIERKLDLAFCTSKGAAVFHYCHFSEKPNLIQTILPQLSLDDCFLPGLFAQGAKIAGSLSMNSISTSDTVDVNGAKIGEQLACADAILNGGKGSEGASQEALDAKWLEVGESFILRSVAATGTVDVTGAKIGGLMTFVHATLDGGKDVDGNTLRSLRAQGLELGKSLVLDSINATGTIDLIGAKIGGQLDCEGATLDGGKDQYGRTLKSLTRRGWRLSRVCFFAGLSTFLALSI